MQTLQNDSYIFLLMVAACFGVLLAIFTLRQRKIAGAYLVGAMLLLSSWFALTYAFELVSVSAASRLFWIKLEYITIVALVPLLLMFSLRFTGRAIWQKRSLRLALLLEPLIILAAVWSMPLHQVFYQSYRLEIIGELVNWQVSYGLLFWAHSFYTYGLFALSLVVLLAKLPRSNRVEQRQIAFICLGGCLTGLGTLLYSTRVSPLGYDHIPLLSILCGTLVSWFVLKSHIFEMSPIALEGVLQSMGDGLILLDRRRVVASFNPAAERITGIAAAMAVSLPLAGMLPELTAKLVGLPPESEIELEVELGLPQNRRIAAVRVSPVRDLRGQIQGRLLLLRDVTEARRVYQSLVAREVELTQTRNFLEKIIATAPLDIAIYNVITQTFEFANPVQEQATPFRTQEIAALFYPEDEARRHELLREVANLADGEVRMLEYRRQAGGEWVWQRVYYAVFERGEAGKVFKILALTSNITGYKHILENLVQSETRFRSLFEGLPIGLYRVTHAGWLLEANPHLVQMLGYPDRASLMAHNVIDFYVNPADRAHMLERLADDPPQHPFEMQLQRRDGEVIWVSDSPRVIIEPHGQMMVEGSLEEITYRKNVDARLQNSEEKFRDMFNLSPNAMLLIDAHGILLDCNMGALHVQGGVSKAEILGHDIFQMVSAEDQGQFLDLLHSTVEEGAQQAHEMTLLRKNGQRFPAEISTSPMPSPVGSPKMMIVTVSDISPRKEAETRLRDMQLQLAQRVMELELRAHQITVLTEMSNMLQVCLNPTEAYGFVGRYGALLFPQTAGQYRMLSADRKLLKSQAGWGLPEEGAPDSYTLDDCWALRSGQAYLSPGHSQTHLCQHFQTAPNFGSLCVPVLSEGQIIGVISMRGLSSEAAITGAQLGMALAMAEQIGLALSNLQLHENLRELAIHDPLTGLYNRYYLREAYENTLQVVQQTGQPVSMIMMDLDYFKAMNTRYGHVNADAVLAKFGSLLREFIANGEVAFRFGGDEFVLIIPNANLEQAAERANAFRQRVRRLVVQPGKQLVIKNLTVSVGISGWPEHGRTLDELLHAADTAMFRAKEQRDQVQIAE